jgi:hypothetical protein
MTKPKFHAGVFLFQWIGNLLLILFCFAWLQVPDSHVWQFAFSILSAIALILAFLWLYSHTFRMLHKVENPAPVWHRWLALVLVVILGYLVFQGLDALRSREALFAGYWNSKFSAEMRSFFTFPRLVSWQDHFYGFLQWIFAALLLPIALIGGSAGLRNGGWGKTGRVYGKLLYWVLSLVAAYIGAWITALLVGWRPSGKPATEIVSVILRLGVAYTIDVLLWCFVLGLIAVYLAPDQAVSTELS